METPRPCAAPGVQLFENRRKMRCRRASGVTDGCGRPRGGDRAACSKHSGYSCPEMPAFNVWGTTVSYAEIPLAHIGIGVPIWGRQRLPRTGSLKGTSAHNQDGTLAPPPSFCSRAPRSGLRPLAHTFSSSRAPREPHGSSSWAPLSLLPHPGGHPAWKELPRWRGGLSPSWATRGLHDQEEEGAGFPIPVLGSRESNNHRNDHCTLRPSFSERLYKCFRP